MTKLADLKKKLMKDEGFRREYEKLDEEFALFESLLKARARANMSQADVAQKLNTTQSAIARLENGGTYPSVRTLRRYAEAVGAQLRIELISRGKNV